MYRYECIWAKNDQIRYLDGFETPQFTLTRAKYLKNAASSHEANFIIPPWARTISTELIGLHEPTSNLFLYLPVNLLYFYFTTN